MVCGPGERAPGDAQAFVAARALVEVLSDSTESYDRGAKWLHYQRIEGLREYLLVAQHESRIERTTRREGGGWTYELFAGGEAECTLPSLEVALPLGEVFADLPA